MRGGITYGELRKHGDFGLGAFNDLDGETVGFDGVFYQLRSDGSARPVTPDQKTPFTVTTFFKPQQELAISQEVSKRDLLSHLEEETDANLFTAIRVDGQFAEVRTRNVQRQTKVDPSLTEATADETTHRFVDVEGTLAGFRSPVYAQGIGVAGFHLHFLRKDKLAGGHALDYRIRRGTVRFAPLRNLHVEPPPSTGL